MFLFFYGSIESNSQQEQVKRKILFLINPISGISNKERIRELIYQRIDKSRYDFEVAFTQYAGHGLELTREAVESHWNAVIAVGGDGSVNEAAAGLVNSETALGIIPSGSGNGLAHFLKLPFNLGRAIESINTFNTVRIDTLTLNDRFCVNVAGVGFDAKVALEFSKVRRRGFWSYFQIILLEYPKYEAQQYTITCNGNTLTRKALLVCFANSNQFGNGAVIAPDARVDDGLMDVCIMSKAPLIEAPFLGQMLITKLINRTHYIEYLKASEVTLIQNDDHVAHIDGDPVFLGSKIYAKINPLSLNVIVP